MRFDSMDRKFINCAKRKSAEVCVALRKSIERYVSGSFHAEAIILPMRIPFSKEPKDFGQGHMLRRISDGCTSTLAIFGS